MKEENKVKKKNGEGDTDIKTTGPCCQVMAIIQIDERGQMVLPKEVREKADIKAGDKLAITTLLKENKVCCIQIMKVEELSDLVKQVLGPILKDIL